MVQQNQHRINSVGRGCDSKQKCDTWLVLPYSRPVPSAPGTPIDTTTRNGILGG